MGIRYIDHSINLLREFIQYYSDTPGFGSLNFTLLILPIVILAISLFLGKILLERKPSLKHYDPRDYPDSLRGFRGLLRIALLLILFIIIINGYNFYNSLFLYGTNTWDFLTMHNAKYPSSWWAFTIYFVTASNFFLLLYSIFIIILAAKKKRIFKFAVIIYLPMTLFISGFKYFLFSQMLDQSHEIVYQSFIYMSFLLQISIVLLLYVAFSRRINATFSN
jgi:hypothetical protein